MRLKMVTVPILSLLVIPALAQMGDPSVGSTKIPNQELDPTRGIRAPVLESTLHAPLPEQYIWTKEDAVPENAVAESGWSGGSGKDLAAHYFRRTFELKSVPDHATLYVAGPRSANIFVNGQQVGSYQLNLDFPMGIRVFACDVTPALRSGKNVLAIEAVRGPDIGSGADSRLSIQQTHGEVLAVKILPAVQGIAAPPLLISDAQWKASMHAAPGWQSAGFDDQSWHNADTLGGIEGSMEFFQWNADAGMYAWPGYDGISPFLAQYHLAPVKVSNVYFGLGKLTSVDSLTETGSASPEFTAELPAASVNLHDAPQVLLDFGREVVGRLELQSDSGEQRTRPCNMASPNRKLSNSRTSESIRSTSRHTQPATAQRAPSVMRSFASQAARTSATSRSSWTASIIQSPTKDISPHPTRH